MSSNPYEIFEVDKEAENNVGISVEYPVKGFPERGFKVRFVHAGETNMKWRDAQRAALKPLKYRIDQELVTDEEFMDILKPLYAAHIIKEWFAKDDTGNYVPGIYGDDFAILPVTKENITATFKKAPRLFRDIRNQAESFATFKKQEQAETAKK